MEKIVKMNAHSYNYDIQETANESITIRELIEILEEFPQDAKIVFRDNRDSICNYLSNDCFREL